MLKAAAATSGAAPVATVEAELAGGVAALLCQWRGGKELAYGIPRAYVAGGVGACCFTYGALVYKYHVR